MMMKRTILTLAVGLPSVFLVSLVVHDQLLKSTFENLTIGETQAAVVQKLGQPRDVVGCGQFGAPSPLGCTHSFSYLSLLTF